MRQDSKVRYYINKKQYIPSESVLLCHTEIDGIKNFTEQSLYRTGKGTFFIVNECKDCETKVQLLTEDSAFEFMNDHTACIDTEKLRQGIRETGKRDKSDRIGTKMSQQPYISSRTPDRNAPYAYIATTAPYKIIF